MKTQKVAHLKGIFALYLQSLRRDRGFQSIELVNKINETFNPTPKVTAPQYSTWESPTNSSTPTEEQLTMLASVLNVPEALFRYKLGLIPTDLLQQIQQKAANDPRVFSVLLKVLQDNQLLSQVVDLTSKQQANLNAA